MKLKFLALAGLTALAATSFQANALPIEGEVTFGLNINTFDGGVISGLQDADFIEVTNNQAVVTGVSGDLSSALSPFSSIVTYNDFFIDGTDLPYSPLWSAAGISFSLIDLQVNTQTSSALGLTGTGIMSLIGYEDTEYQWSFSADESGGEFTAASATNTPVPEPGTLALLGLGLAGLGAARRRQKA